jgi:hypothetical protein
LKTGNETIRVPAQRHRGQARKRGLTRWPKAATALGRKVIISRALQHKKTYDYYELVMIKSNTL